MKDSMPIVKIFQDLIKAVFVAKELPLESLSETPTFKFNNLTFKYKQSHIHSHESHGHSHSKEKNDKHSHAVTPAYQFTLISGIFE